MSARNGSAAWTIRFGGDAGDGVVSTGELFALGAARSGFHIFTVRSVPAEIRGGHAAFTVRASAAPVHSQGDAPDAAVVFNLEAYERIAGRLAPGGILIYNADAFTPPADGLRGDVRRFSLPLTALARGAAGVELAKNIVSLGVAASLAGIPPGVYERLVTDRFGRKGGAVAEKNVRALRAGWAHAREHLLPQDLLGPAPAAAAARRLIVTGNEASAMGAIAAGCRRFFGYPITPATDIFEVLAAELPRLGGAVVQAEDEIASLAMCIGSAYAGEQAMTATSGPGLSLMTELIGYAAMAEIPVVIVDVQRAGPSTGMPTKTEQADLWTTAFGGHGDFPRAVIAAVDVEDAFYQTANAFRLAETYQMPVILLTDQSLAQRAQTIPEPDAARAAVEVRRPSAAPGNGWHRFVREPGRGPALPVPGAPGLIWKAPGLEHDDDGFPSTDPANRERMMRLRMSKLEAIPPDACGLAEFGDPDAETLVIGWGSTYGAAREAVARLNAAGTPVGAIWPKLLWPFPTRALAPRVARARRVIVPETNYSGQFAALLAMHLGVRPVRINRYDGLSFEPGALAERIREAMETDGGA